MAQDFTLSTTSAIIKALKASAPFTDVIPKAQIFGMVVPASRTWPFTRIASIIGSPFLATGLDSSAFRITMQGFAKDGSAMPAAESAIAIGAAFAEVLDGAILLLPSGMKLAITWVQNQAMMDGDEAGAWMVSSVFRGQVAG